MSLQYLALGTSVIACPIISLRNLRGISKCEESRRHEEFVEADEPVAIGLTGLDWVSVFGRDDSYRGSMKYWHGFLVVISRKANHILMDDCSDDRGIGIRISSSSSSVSTVAAFSFPLSCLDRMFSFISSSSYNRSAYFLTASAPSLYCSIIEVARSRYRWVLATRSLVARSCIKSCFSYMICNHSSICLAKFLKLVITYSVTSQTSLATAAIISAWAIRSSPFM